MSSLVNTTTKIQIQRKRRKAAPHTTREENKDMARKSRTRGWYTFADGYYAWFHGLSADEKKLEIMRHGKIVRFEPTP